MAGFEISILRLVYSNFRKGYPLLEIGSPGRSPAMNKRFTKPFDCVEFMRQARDRLSSEMEGMTYEEMRRWIRSQRHEDPVLQRLADKAARQADEADRPPSAADLLGEKQVE
jgi:hypothetical protein